MRTKEVWVSVKTPIIRKIPIIRTLIQKIESSDNDFDENWELYRKWMVLITHLKICRLRDVNESVDLFFFFFTFQTQMFISAYIEEECPPTLNWHIF